MIYLGNSLSSVYAFNLEQSKIQYRLTTSEEDAFDPVIKLFKSPKQESIKKPLVTIRQTLHCGSKGTVRVRQPRRRIRLRPHPDPRDCVSQKRLHPFLFVSFRRNEHNSKTQKYKLRIFDFMSFGRKPGAGLPTIGGRGKPPPRKERRQLQPQKSNLEWSKIL